MRPYVIAGLAFVAVAFATISLVLLWETIRAALRRRQVASRLRQATELRAPVDAGSGSLLREESLDDSALALLLARVPQFRGLGTLLEQAGTSISVQAFFLLTVGAAVAFGLFAFVLTGILGVALVAAWLGGSIPLMSIRRRRNKRLSRFEQLFPEAIDLMGRAIRAGHPLSSGMQMVADEITDPVATEFRTVFEEQRFGVPFADALMGMCDRIDLVDVRIFTTAVLIQREVGGNLAEILDNLSDTIRGRFRIRRQLDVYTAQGRISGLVVGSMPFAVGLGMYALQPEYIRMLFEHPLGRIMLVVALVAQVVGYFWIRKIVRIEI